VARRGLGGSGDWSGTFASLYSFNKNESKARQQAADQDAADKWANGLMSDDEWLAYIRTSIERESGNPKDQQHWITALRKYSSLIADKQAESEYEMGGTINDLIAHYQDRLSGMVKDSNEYRETQLHLNDLLDKRSGETLTDAAEDMVEQINAGKKTYTDLLRLLQQGKTEARDNSDLRKSIDKQIDQVRETIRVNALEGSFEKLQYEYDAGKISGGTYAKRLRSMAGQFKENDPKRYYQILEAAIALEKSGGRAGGGSGGGGSRRGSGGGGGGSSTKSINATIDSLQAERNSAQALLEQFEAGAQRGVDPMTGQTVVFNPGIVRELDEKVVRSMDRLSSAYTAKGDLSAAANTQKAKAYFIANNVTAHNTFSVEDSRRELMSSTAKVLNDALSNPDPTSGMNGVRFVAQQWDKFSRGLTEQAVKGANYGGDTKRGLPAESGETVFMGQPKGPMDQVDPELANQAGMFASSLAALSQPGVDDATAASAIEALYAITGKTGASGDPASNPWVALATRALEVNARQQGLATGDLVRVATPSGLVWARTTEVTYTAPDPTGANAVQVTKKVPTEFRDNSGKWVPLEVDGKTSKLVDVFVDINGTPTKVTAKASLTSPQGFEGWVADETKVVNGVQLIAGQALTEAQLKKISQGRTALDLAKAGVIRAAPLLNQWTVTVPGYTDKNGNKRSAQTWNQDPATGMWYLGALPIRGVQRDENGMVRFGDQGPLIDWKSYGSAWGVPAPYAGEDPKAMQDRLNNGEVDTSSLMGRDLNGQPVDDPHLDGAYWDPKIAVIGGAIQDFMNGRGWWNESDRKRRTSELKTQAEIDVENRKRPSGDPDKSDDGIVGAFSSALKSVSDALGINLGGTQPRPSMGSIPERKPDQSFAPRREESVAPKITLPDGKKRASGPAIRSELGELNVKPTTPAAAPKIKAPPPQGAPGSYRPPPTKPPSGGAPGAYRPPAPTSKTQTTKKRGGGYLD